MEYRKGILISNNIILNNIGNTAQLARMFSGGNESRIDERWWVVNGGWNKLRKVCGRSILPAATIGCC